MKTYFSNLRGSTFASVVSAVLLLFFGGGCATEVGQHTFLKQPYPAKPKDHPIDVYIQDLPTKPFERVAVLDAHCESQYWAKPSLEKDAIPELKRQAREAGCDAIIEVSEIKPAAKNWTLETRTMHVTATGIIYK